MALGVAVTLFQHPHTDALRELGTRRVPEALLSSSSSNHERILTSLAPMLQYAAAWRTAVSMALRDALRAAHSSGIAFYLTLQPLVWLLAWLVGDLLLKRLLYETIILRGICSETAVRQSKAAVRHVIKWQLARTPRQIMGQVALMVTLGLLWRWRRFFVVGWRRGLRRVRAIRNGIAKVRQLATTTREEETSACWIFYYQLLQLWGTSLLVGLEKALLCNAKKGGALVMRFHFDSRPRPAFCVVRQSCARLLTRCILVGTFRALRSCCLSLSLRLLASLLYCSPTATRSSRLRAPVAGWPS